MLCYCSTTYALHDNDSHSRMRCTDYGPNHAYSTGSICLRNGYLMVYPLESNITWVQGLESMTSYTFGKNRIAHTFCSTCGTSIGGKSTDPNFFGDNRAVNVRLPTIL